MIFNSNHTSLGSTIPMAEGYDCSYGTALALVESARNDYKMFNAMLGVDYQELSMRNSGYTNESVVALNEAAVGGIFKKIAELLKKLVAKVKSIFHTFMGKMNGLFMKDKDLVKKYEKEVLRKGNIGNLEVKWCKVKNDPIKLQLLDAPAETGVNDFHNCWDEDRDKLYDNVTKKAGSVFSWDDYATSFDEYCFDDEETIQIKDITGGIRGIMTFLSEYQKKFNDLTKNVNTLTKKLEKLVTAANKAANEATKPQEGDTEQSSSDRITNANHDYEVAQAYQTVVLKDCQCVIDAVKKQYKYNRAAFSKAITANDSKLKESTYLDAVAEAAEDEVEAVISDALSDEELSDLSAASTNVKDGDVCDCPEKLVYDKVQHYTDNADMDSAQGSVDVDVNARTESAFFGQMLY